MEAKLFELVGRQQVRLQLQQEQIVALQAELLAAQAELAALKDAPKTA